MKLWEEIRRDWDLLSGVIGTYRAYGGISDTFPETVGDDLEKAADKFAGNVAFRFDGRSVTYAEFDKRANRVAHWARAQGLKKGDVVALFALNQPDYVAIWMGLSKIGIVTALINTNLVSAPLAHCINIAECDHVIVDDPLAAAYATAETHLTRKPKRWLLRSELSAALETVSDQRPARDGLLGGALCLLVYTSGTTGAPKAARMPHWRVQGMMRAFLAGAHAKASDRNYLCLPLYHSTGGLCAVGLMLERGGCVILRERFSATHFWRDIAEEGATVFFYVGEMCRYLLNQAPAAIETKHKLRLMVGNGLRPDVWAKFQERFRIPKVLEFYGSTEGNVNMLNFDGKTGAIGRVPDWLRPVMNVRLVKFDVETEAPVRNAEGLCIEADIGETGEAIGEIRHDQPRYQFEGYAHDKAQTAKKILRDVFKKGDAWFRTGDLLRRDKDSYFYFVDRIGDTFRWKGENVSTNEVAERITAYPGVEEAIVYGVHIASAEGRAGMAVLNVRDGFDLQGLRAHLYRELPAYARPVFIRLRQNIETTGTFKYRKVDLVNEGFDPSEVDDPLYFDDSTEQKFVPVTADLAARIESGAVKL